MHVNACKEAPLAANTTAATDQLSAEIHTLQMAQESIMQQLAGPAASVTQVGLEALPAGRVPAPAASRQQQATKTSLRESVPDISTPCSKLPTDQSDLGWP